jgi:hypothetical protein
MEKRNDLGGDARRCFAKKLPQHGRPLEQSVRRGVFRAEYLRLTHEIQKVLSIRPPKGMLILRELSPSG